MSAEATPLSTLDDETISVLDDMADEWINKDRHGELRSEFDYSDAQLAAFYTLYSALCDERKRRFGY